MIAPISVLRSVALAGLCGASLAIADVAVAAVSHQPQPAKADPVLLAQGNTIVDIAAGDEQFSTLVTALEAAELTDALATDGPFTVFAPTNEAFAALPPEALDALLEPENQDLLVELLTYHVAPEELGSDTIISESSVDTLNGPVNVDVVDDEVMINQANVIVPDVEASNGVIHVIDAVLIPDGLADALAARMAADTETPTTETPTTGTPTTEPTTTTPTTTPAEPVRGLW